MPLRTVADVCCENRMKHINSLCGNNEEFTDVRSGNAWSFHYALEDYINMNIYSVCTRYLWSSLLVRVITDCRSRSVAPCSRNSSGEGSKRKPSPISKYQTEPSLLVALEALSSAWFGEESSALPLFLPVSCLAHSSTVKMEAMGCS